MANKTLITRIQNKIDELGSWKAVESTFKPLRGEICIVEVPSGDPTATTAPTCLIKIGNGEDFFKDLTYLSAPAADVYSWAKKSETDFKAWVKTLVTVDDINLGDYALKTEVEAVSGVANKNKTDLAELTTTVSTLQSTHTTDKAALETSIATAKKAGDDAQSDLNAYKTSNDAAVAKALTDAKAYTDTLANGTVKTNTENIGKNTTAIATLRTDIQNGESIDSFADVETELAKYQLAGDYATKAEAQGYANAKDVAIAEAKKAGTDANAALEAYKTSNNEVVAGHTTAIAELETAIGNLGTNAGETYETKTDAAQKLKDAKDYTDALANDAVAKNTAAVAKNTAAIATLNGNDEGSVNKKIADAINKFATDVTDNGTIDKFAELVTYVANHGGEASEMATAIEDLETKVGNETVEKQISDAITEANLGQYAKDSDLDALAKTVSDMDTAYKAKDTEITTELAKKATAEDLGKATTRIGTLETEMDTAEGKIKTLEDVGSEKNVIVSVKVNDAALTPDANRAVNVTVPTGALASKNTVDKSDLATALASELDAKATEADLTLAEGRIAQNETDIDDLQTAKHTHSNKALLDTYTQTEANLADAVAKKHEHGNKSVIDGITAENVTTWNTVTSKASQSDLTSATNRVTALEDRIGFDGDVLIFDCGSSTVNV